MNKVAKKLHDRAERKNRKRDEKKQQLAWNAIEVLQVLGYANTGLRDIAANSKLSLGILHYYFEDKTELITYCVCLYKKSFIKEICQLLEGPGDRKKLIARLSRALANSIIENGKTHLLWYDIRTQALFDPAFRPAVAEVETALVEIADQLRQKMGVDIDPAVEFAALDGIFHFLLEERMFGKERDLKELAQQFAHQLERW